MAGLSDEETRRARSARSDSFRDEFVRTRQILRRLLGRYLQAPPDEIALQVNAEGKPSLAVSAGHALQFNLAHAGGSALFAFACGRSVGVDLDLLDRVAHSEAVAKRSFSPREQQALAALPEPERQAAFMRGWVRKEAYTKARGKGFQYGFSRFTVSLEAREPGSLLLADEFDSQATQAWTLLDVPVEPPAAAAVAVAGRVTKLQCWRLGV